MSDHIVQLFDTQPSRAKALAQFVAAGLNDGDTVLVVARSKHWKAAERQLRRMGSPVAAGVANGGVVVLDADVMLASFMRRGKIDISLFHEVIGRFVRDLATRTRRHLRIYGELVDLLAEEANLEAAQKLEALWNDLARRWPFTLLCGYAAAHFTDPKTAAALCAICDAHTHVASDADDLLGNWILRENCRNAA